MDKLHSLWCHQMSKYQILSMLTAQETRNPSPNTIAATAHFCTTSEYRYSLKDMPYGGGGGD